MAVRRRFRSRRARIPGVELVFCALISAVIVALGLFSGRRSRHSGAPSVVPRLAATSTPSLARSELAALPQAELSPEVAYDRTADFGRPWVDVDGNGCDTRNDVLRRDLADVRLLEAGNGCLVAAGTLADPYTGATILFSRSAATAVQIDHLIPLHAAWQLGAWRWTPARRLSFANDPRELIAVSGPANLDKGDALADRWRPPNKTIWCPYAIDSVGVHVDYALGVTAGERQALGDMLDRCG